MYIVYNIHVMFYIIMFNRYPIVQETTEKHRKHSPFERKPSPKQLVASGKMSSHMGKVSYVFQLFSISVLVPYNKFSDVSCVQNSI